MTLLGWGVRDKQEVNGSFFFFFRNKCSQGKEQGALIVYNMRLGQKRQKEKVPRKYSILHNTEEDDY